MNVCIYSYIYIYICILKLQSQWVVSEMLENPVYTFIPIRERRYGWGATFILTTNYLWKGYCARVSPFAILQFVREPGLIRCDVSWVRNCTFVLPSVVYIGLLYVRTDKVMSSTAVCHVCFHTPGTLERCSCMQCVRFGVHLCSTSSCAIPSFNTTLEW